MKIYFYLLILTTSLFANNIQNELDYAKKLWPIIEKINSTDKNVNIIKGIGPHGPYKSVLEKTINGQRVLIKKEYTKEGLQTVCVMIKIAGYDKKNHDWFWIRYKKNGEIDSLLNNHMVGKFPACISCHKNASGKDFVFLNDKEAILEKNIITELQKFTKGKEEDFLTEF